LVATEAVKQEFIYNAVGGGGFADVNAAVIWALVVLLVFHLAVFNPR